MSAAESESGSHGDRNSDTWGQEPWAQREAICGHMGERFVGTAGSDLWAQRGQEPSASETGLLPNPRAAKNENESPEGLSFSLVAGTGFEPVTSGL